jgi:hypothetical protein
MWDVCWDGIVVEMVIGCDGKMLSMYAVVC